jgi:hypothetical protein
MAGVAVNLPATVNRQQSDLVRIWGQLELIIEQIAAVIEHLNRIEKRDEHRRLQVEEILKAVEYDLR